MVFNASSQEQAVETVAQTVYVYDEDFNGTPLSDVQVSGQDAIGNNFEGITDEDGAVILNGQPGTWHFVFTKEGYNPLDLDYDVTETGEGAVYLQRSIPTQAQNQVAQNVYVYDNSFNGTVLSDVQVTGQDADGNSIEGITDENGVVVLYGQPGTWHFVFTKEGYDPLDLDYDVTETGEGAVYLQRSSSSFNQPHAQDEPPRKYLEPVTTDGTPYWRIISE